MKYCHNCGAALGDSAASFCSECGKPLIQNNAVHEQASESTNGEVKNLSGNQKKTKRADAVKKRKKEKATQKEIVDEPVDDGYDGYYNDVLPPDLDWIKEGLDKELIKKIAAVAVGAVFIISICVVMLCLL